MRKYLGRRDTRFFCRSLSFLPIFAFLIRPFPFLVMKISPETVLFFMRVLQQLAPQLPRNENCTDFAFQRDLRLTLLSCFPQ